MAGIGVHDGSESVFRMVRNTHRRVFKVLHRATTPTRTRTEPLTPLVGELEETLIEELRIEIERSSLVVPDFGDFVRFGVRVLFNEPRRAVRGIVVSDYPSYYEFLYRAWLLSERRPWPLIAKVSRARRFLKGMPPAEIEQLRKVRGRLVHLVWDLWAAYRALDRQLFSYRRLARRVYRLLSFGLARRPYVMNGRRWGLGAHDLPERGLARTSDGS